MNEGMKEGMKEGNKNNRKHRIQEKEKKRKERRHDTKPGKKEKTGKEGINKNTDKNEKHGWLEILKPDEDSRFTEHRKKENMQRTKKTKWHCMVVQLEGNWKWKAIWSFRKRTKKEMKNSKVIVGIACLT